MDLRFTNRSVAALLVAGMLLCAACGGGAGRRAVEGQVSFDGQPIDKGSIVFLPVAEGAIKTGGPIAEGRYAIPAEKGPTPGKHKVLLFWEKKTGQTYVDRDSGDVYDRRVEGLPKVYQSENTPLEVEIAGGRNVHDFRLSSKGS